MKLLIALLVIFLSAPALAQFSSPWGDAPFWERPSARSNASPQESAPRGPSIASGGARPEIAPKAPASIVFPYSYPANSVIIDTSERKLYYVLGDQQAYEYPISVGRDGFSWTGTESISRIQTWPDWYPPSEMRARDRRLPEKMTGGVRNPLGAVALYLGNSLYRIHGTNAEKTIGEAASSGCFRMMTRLPFTLPRWCRSARLSTFLTTCRRLWSRSSLCFQTAIAVPWPGQLRGPPSLKPQ